MSMLIIQADYEQLEAIAARFQGQGQQTQEVQRQLRQRYEILRDGGWEGRGAAAFAAEMEHVVLPALERLTETLLAADDTARTIMSVVSSAEAEAAALFQSQGAVGETAASQGSAEPLPAWVTAPFAALASVLGPVPVPILGARGLVPAIAASNPGARLWLYIGGSGTDTLFSVHPHSGWGRAPFRLRRPNLRFDYGALPNRNPNAVLPNGRRLHLASNRNFFHWNQQGGHALFGVVDHQLMTNNPTPRGNVLSSIAGARWIRYGSRAFFVAGAAMDVYSVYTAENRAQEAVQRTAAWGGAWAGAKGGAMFGATIGTFIGGPGPGTAIGGIVGGVIGGIGGYIAGENVGGHIYDWGGQGIRSVQGYFDGTPTMSPAPDG